jgi:hypothetical protein
LVMAVVAFVRLRGLAARTPARGRLLGRGRVT